MADDKEIIRYLDGEMRDDERREFEKKISENPGLAEEVESIRKLQKLADKALGQTDDPEDKLDEETRREIQQAVLDFKEGDKADLPEDVEEQILGARQDFELRRAKGHQATEVIESGSQSSHTKQIRRLWFSASAILVLAVVVSILIFRPFKSKPARNLYTAYYQEYPMTSEMVELSRADDDLLFAIKVYEAGDYERAAVLFEMLTDSAGVRDYALFYAGHALLHQNLTEKAIESFQELLNDGQGDLMPATRWYLALAYLKAGDATLSKKQLLLIEQTDSPFRKKARMLLRDLP